MSSSPPPPHADDGAEEGATRSDGGGKAFSYAEAGYWDARYVEEGVAPYDWYQLYAALRPFVRRFAPPASRLLMIGCGSALMSEDMVDDGYVEIMNIDISSVVIEMMRKKYFNVPQLQYMQMDVRDMGIFSDESFDCAIDKGTLDSLMCGLDAPLSAAQMVLEVDRLLKPGGVFMLITYGDPSVRVPHLNQSGCNWEIVLYILRALDPSSRLRLSICRWDGPPPQRPGEESRKSTPSTYTKGYKRDVISMSRTISPPPRPSPEGVPGPTGVFGQDKAPHGPRKGTWWTPPTKVHHAPKQQAKGEKTARPQ